MKRNSPKNHNEHNNEQLTAVARADNLKLAEYYGRLLEERGIIPTIITGDETAGRFRISILVPKISYDEAFLFIEMENSQTGYYLDSMFEPPNIHRQTG